MKKTSWTRPARRSRKRFSRSLPDFRVARVTAREGRSGGKINQNKNMNNYYIYTDGGSEEIKAANIAEALRQWGEAPKWVKTADDFERWLTKCGGFGGIQENGLQIANVRQ